jgi:Epoxide hydrolase N terminus
MPDQIKPFVISVPGAEPEDLNDRLRRTRWPEREPVGDWSQGVPLDYLLDLCRYWAGRYDWRATEARLNQIPQFTTMIDGLNNRVLADRHRGILGPAVPGEHRPGHQMVHHRRQRHCRRAGRVQHLPQGGAPALPPLGPAPLYEHRVLEPARPRRPLRRVGTTQPVHRRSPRRGAQLPQVDTRKSAPCRRRPGLPPAVIYKTPPSATSQQEVGWRRDIGDPAEAVGSKERSLVTTRPGSAASRSRSATGLTSSGAMPTGAGGVRNE